MVRRNNRPRRQRRRRAQSLVTEIIVSSLQLGTTTAISNTHFSNVPKFSIWRPRRVTVQAVDGSNTNTPAAVQVVIRNSSNERVAASSVRMLSASRTTIACVYPRTAEWFSPISTGAEDVIDISVVCTGKADPNFRIGVVITIKIQVKSEIPSAACPTMPRVQIEPLNRPSCLNSYCSFEDLQA